MSYTVVAHHSVSALLPRFSRAVADVTALMEEGRVRLKFRIARELDPWGKYDPRGPTVTIAPRVVRANGWVLRSVLAHEMAHHYQYFGDTPHGERQADLEYLAICGAEFPPASLYLSVPGHVMARPELYAVELAELARKAWSERLSGRRRYLLWFEEQAARIEPLYGVLASFLPGEPREVRVDESDNAPDPKQRRLG